MTSSPRFNRPGNLSVLAASVLMLMASSSMAGLAKDDYLADDGGITFLPGLNGGGGGTSSSGASLGLSFAGVSQFDLRSLLGGSFIPPDTMGAVGATQFMETTNGVYAVYNKATGATQQMLRGDTFWANAGSGTGNLSGDARVMFDQPSGRWMVASFAKNNANISIAVSNTSDATAGWKSTTFTGFSGGIADFPTLAIDSQAVYIGTNNFKVGCMPGSPTASRFCGTTLNVIKRSDLLGAAAPSTASLKQFTTPYTYTASTEDRGYAIQGVNSTGPVSGRIAAVSISRYDLLRYNIANPGTAGATQGAVSYLGLPTYTDTAAARQPKGSRNIDTSDDRVGSSVWEKNGRIYAVHTTTPGSGAGVDHTQVSWSVTDANTNAIIDNGTIGDPNYDFYQGSLAVNSSGQVVIGYNRSGLSATDGKVRIYARTFDSLANGHLSQTGDVFLKESLVDDYHNGSTFGNPPAGRQRWGDYSAVTVDPSNGQNFWVIGQYAIEYNDTASGHTGGGGESSWGTWISEVTVAQAVPEPQTYLMMLGGLLAVGAAARRKANQA